MQVFEENEIMKPIKASSRYSEPTMPKREKQQGELLRMPTLGKSRLVRREHF